MINKKVVVISASPRKGGNSDTLSDSFISGAKESGHNVKKIALREKEIHFCKGCYYCVKNEGKCVMSDDMADIIEDIIQADVLVMATPVYFYCMNGQLKTVIDRTVARYTEIRNKEAYLIATAAEDGMHAMEGTITSFRSFLDCLVNVKEAGLVLGMGLNAKGDTKGKPIMQTAYEMGKSI